MSTQRQAYIAPPISERAQSDVELAAALCEVARSVGSTLDLRTIFERIFDMLRTFIPYDSASIMLLQEEGTTLVVVAGQGFPPGINVEGCVLQVYPDATHYPVVGEGRVRVIADVRNECGWQDHIPANDYIRSWMGAPLIVEGRVIGMLTIDKWEPDAYTMRHATVAEAFGSHVAMAIRNAKLYEESQRAFAELRKTQAELLRHEKLRALGELASGVAHDFNNVLTGILGNVQLLLQEVDEPGLRGGLRVVERAAQDGAVMIKRLQEFARPTPAGPLAPADLGTVAEAALRFTKPRWQGLPTPEHPAVKVMTELAPAHTAPVESAELRQVLINMLLNALDAMPDGGTLRVATGTRGDEAYILVQDTGIGIPDELQARIFDPFFTTKGQRGSGMGLAMCQALISRQGGRITVESRLGHGSTFTVWLPRGSASTDTAPPATLLPACRSAAVLVVDDEGEIRSLVRRSLQAQGFRVTAVASVAEAEQVMRDRCFDLILTDLSMPEVSGWELIRNVREHNQQIGIALMSGWGHQITDAIAQNDLVDHTLAKPFTLDELHRCIVSVTTTMQQRMCKNAQDAV